MKCNIKFSKYVLKISLVCMLLNLIQAQSKLNSTRISPDPNLITCTTLQINIEVVVTDRKGKDITDLRHNNFVVYENKIKQEIVAWKKLEVNINRVPHIKHVLSYEPSNDLVDGTLRKIKVKITTIENRKVKVRLTPKSYVATASVMKF